ncbi:MAG: DUF3486 family protein [Rhizobiales bacterium]|nr:DUF3486 family protein [Hyphomicrobiales bacterium]
MARNSSIDGLDPKLKKAIDAALRSGTSIDALVKKIQDWGADISRSAVGRYSKSFNETMEKINIAREMSERIVEDIGKAGESKMTRATIELIQTSVVQMIANNGGTVPMKYVGTLSKSAVDLAKAKKIDQETILEIQRVTIAKAAVAVEKVGAELGFTQDTIDTVKNRIFNIED